MYFDVYHNFNLLPPSPHSPISIGQDLWFRVPLFSICLNLEMRTNIIYFGSSTKRMPKFWVHKWRHIWIRPTDIDRSLLAVRPLKGILEIEKGEIAPINIQRGLGRLEVLAFVNMYNNITVLIGAKCQAIGESLPLRIAYIIKLGAS